MRNVWLAGLSIPLALGAAAQEAPLVIERQVSTLRLRPTVQVREAPVQLAELLDFAGADPELLEALADAPLFDPSGGRDARNQSPKRERGLHEHRSNGSTDVNDAPARVPGSDAEAADIEVTHAQIEQRLGEIGVNLSRVLIEGALVCRIRIAEPQPAVADREPDANAAPLLLPRGEKPPTELLLADAIRRRAARELDAPPESVEVAYEPGRAEFLALTSPPFEFDIHGSRDQRLGLREFRVTILRDGRRQRTVSVFGRVRLVRQVLVAAQPLNIGAVIRADSVRSAPRLFEQDGDLGLDHPEAVIGQQVRRFIPEGRMIHSTDLKDTDLVQRSRAVTVVGDGPVGLRLHGVALDSGGYGDSVRVRLGTSRHERREVRGTVVGVGTVRLGEEN